MTMQPLSTIRPLTTIAPTTDPMPSMRRVRYHLFIRDYTKTVVDDLGEHMTLRYARFIGCQTVRALDGNSGAVKRRADPSPPAPLPAGRGWPEAG